VKATKKTKKAMKAEKAKRKSLTSRGERVKSRLGEAMKRDLEQTKHDLSMGKAGKDLHQDVDDTLEQATGDEPIPPRSVKNPD
jgi:hypothetical protein